MWKAAPLMEDVEQEGCCGTNQFFAPSISPVTLTVDPCTICGSILFHKSHGDAIDHLQDPNRHFEA